MAGANVWHFTAAGRAALADGNNRGTNEVSFTQMAIGTGQGAGGEADDALTSLRQQVEIENLGGSTTVQGRIAVEAAFMPANAIDVTLRRRRRAQGAVVQDGPGGLPGGSGGARRFLAAPPIDVRSARILVAYVFHQPLHSLVTCHVDDIDAHHARARAEGATIVGEPREQHGGRMYRAADPEGHRWIFRTPGPQ